MRTPLVVAAATVIPWTGAAQEKETKREDTSFVFRCEGYCRALMAKGNLGLARHGAR